MIPLCYYDGIKEEACPTKNILHLWSSEKEDHEEWFLLKNIKNGYLDKYLQSKIGILDLFQNSDIYFCKRYYHNYDKLQNCVKISLNDKNIVFPKENIFLTKK